MRRSPAVSLVLLLALGAALAAPPAEAQEIRDRDLYLKSLEAARQAVGHFGSLDDPAAARRVAQIGYRIARASGFTDFPFTFHLVEIGEPNAFALPGGQIFITRGMLRLDLDDDMLAGLLGHEIAHVVLQHGLRMQRRATLLNVLSQALVLGVMVGASREAPRVYDPYGRDPRSADTGSEVLEGAAAAGVVLTELLLRSYSREFEDEADEEGQRWAAEAGYDPAGTRALMERMQARIPQSAEYGYWRTHPFFDERVVAADARQSILKIQPAKEADAFRQGTQSTLLQTAGSLPAKHQEAEIFLKQAALLAWPVGEAAESLRLERLHAYRDQVQGRPALYQDYGTLISEYEETREEVRELSPGSALPERLEGEVATFRRRLETLYPQAVKVLEGGIYETEFLEIFASNYPESPELPRVALALADAHARLGEQRQAVDRYLQVWSLAPQAPEGERALSGLRTLTPRLDRLAALEQLTALEEDSEIRELATRRLEELATTYKDLANGAEYLHRYPEGPMAEVVRDRLHSLADTLLAEVILYQELGDHGKAVERIEKILSHAPFSPAAERLRESAVVKS